jgi:hypothetical protein
MAIHAPAPTVEGQPPPPIKKKEKLREDLKVERNEDLDEGLVAGFSAAEVIAAAVGVVAGACIAIPAYYMHKKKKQAKHYTVN